ncbi:hypothetical protein ACF07M_29910 [Streptomyces globisporus]|uniref:hypothetical protein n=1 Tax=Streptomyces globisporus TaxID=1908 RepID=UPI0036F8561C
MTDTPMAPDQPTPVELTEQQMGALIDAGNRALNDHYHEDQCHCDSWPASCVSSGNYFMGAWDTNAFAIGVPAVIGVWETLRNDRHKAKVAELRADNKALRARIAELTAAPVDEAVEMAEAEAELAAMRREHPDPCRVPDSPDCTCPAEPSLPLCGKTVAVDGAVYAPCARHAGHSAAYCRDSARNHYFLAADLHGPTP